MNHPHPKTSTPLGGTSPQDAAAAAAAAKTRMRMNRSAIPAEILHSIPESPRLAELLARHPDKFGDLLEDPARFRLQILIGLGEHLQPIEHHGFRVDAEYFYPASVVKLCSAVAATEVLKELSLAGIAVNRNSPFVIHPLPSVQPGAAKPFVYELPEKYPGDWFGGNPPGTFDGIARDIRRALMISDNPAHNRLYEFVGHETINKLMWRGGLPTVRINHRLSDFRSPADQRRTARIDFLAGSEIAYTVPERDSSLMTDNASFAGLAGLHAGRGYIDPVSGKHCDEPMDFTGRNRLGLLDMHKLLARQLHFDPRLGPKADYVDADFVTLFNALATVPRECPDLRFDKARFPDAQFKWYGPGLARLKGGRTVAIANKVGRAYGFSTDTAMMFPTRGGGRATLFLTATLFTCAGGIIGGDQYEYDRADRFFADLAEVAGREFWALRSR